MSHRSDAARPEPAANLLYGTTIRSTVLAGRVRAIHWHGDCDWQHVVTVDHRDLPRPDRVSEMLGGQPLLVAEDVRHLGEPILLLAAETPELRDCAARSVSVECEVHEPVLTIEKSLAAFQVLHADDNVYERYDFERGNPQQGMAEADFVREDKFRISGLESMRFRPQAATAMPTDDGGMRIVGSCPAPDRIHRLVCALFGLPAEKVDVIDEGTGELEAAWRECFRFLPVHAALLARKAGRPVQLDYTRQEDMLGMARRHPGIIRHRSGFRADGTLIARDILVFLDGGAYRGASAEVLVRALLHAGGPYRCPHLRVRGRAVATHTPANGSPFGDGVPQVTAASELHLDRAATGLGLEPHQLRRMNLWRSGADHSGGEPALCGGVGGDAVLEQILARTGYDSRWHELSGGRAAVADDETRLHGIGLAMSIFGCGLDVGLVDRAGPLLRGELQPEYSCGAHVVEVEVDRRSGEVEVKRIAAAAGTGPLEPTDGAGARFAAGSLRSLEFGYRLERRGEGESAESIGRTVGLDAVEIDILAGTVGTGPGGGQEMPAWAQCGAGAALVAAVSQALQIELDSMPLTPQGILAALDSSWRPWRALNR